MTDKKTVNHLSRRAFGLSTLAAMGSSKALASPAIRITWDDLIPAGLPYGQIIGDGFKDFEADIWRPIYDANGYKLNTGLNNTLIKLPGYIVPLDFSGTNVTSFILVPFVGACIHVPPPPPNQLVFVTTKDPWPTTELWDPVFVTGTLHTQKQMTEIAEIGYTLISQKIEVYQ